MEKTSAQEQLENSNVGNQEQPLAEGEENQVGVEHGKSKEPDEPLGVDEIDCPIPCNVDEPTGHDNLVAKIMGADDQSPVDDKSASKGYGNDDDATGVADSALPKTGNPEETTIVDNSYIIITGEGNKPPGVDDTACPRSGNMDKSTGDDNIGAKTTSTDDEPPVDVSCASKRTRNDDEATGGDTGRSKNTNKNKESSVVYKRTIYQPNVGDDNSESSQPRSVTEIIVDAKTNAETSDEDSSEDSEDASNCKQDSDTETKSDGSSSMLVWKVSYEFLDNLHPTQIIYPRRTYGPYLDKEPPEETLTVSKWRTSHAARWCRVHYYGLTTKQTLIFLHFNKNEAVTQHHQTNPSEGYVLSAEEVTITPLCPLWTINRWLDRVWQGNLFWNLAQANIKTPGKGGVS